MKHHIFHLLYCVMILSSAIVPSHAVTIWTVTKQPLLNVPENRQFATLAEAVECAEPGDTIEIHTGVYRETVIIPKEKSGKADQPLRIVAAPTAEVVLSGSDRLTEWKPEPELGDCVVGTDWPHYVVPPHPGDKEHEIIGRPEQVFVQQYLLRRVLELEKLAPGTFFIDPDNKRIYVWDETNRKAGDFKSLFIEASHRSFVLRVDADHVHIRGIRFRHCANRAQGGMVLLRGNNGLVEDCVFEHSNGVGAVFTGTGNTALRCEFTDNGQLGFSAGRAHGLRLESCLIARNNYKNYSRGWEAGGNKIVLSRNVVIDRCVSRDNRGVGFWFDIGNENCEVKNCLIYHNEEHGLFYEISYGLYAHDNVIVANGYVRDPWGYGAGIKISDSMGCVMERNLCVGNIGDGLMYRDQRRTTSRIDRQETSTDKDPKRWLKVSDNKTEYWIWNQDHVVKNNIFAYNNEAQIGGWFDVADARHWPRVFQVEMLPTRSRGTFPYDDRTAPYQATEGEEPLGRSFETLGLSHENNFFAKGENQKLYMWGVPWQKHRFYSAIENVRKDLPDFENGTREGVLDFADFRTLDLRLPEGTDVLEMNCYPQGQVPGVTLGTFVKD